MGGQILMNNMLSMVLLLLSKRTGTALAHAHAQGLIIAKRSSLNWVPVFLRSQLLFIARYLRQRLESCLH